MGQRTVDQSIYLLQKGPQTEKVKTFKYLQNCCLASCPSDHLSAAIYFSLQHFGLVLLDGHLIYFTQAS